MKNRTQIYFQPIVDYFWQYEENGKVIAIPNAYTIAYSEQVFEIVQNLSVAQLPSLGSILFVMAATNQKGVESVNAVASLLRINEGNLSNLKLAIEFGRLLAELPDQYKTGKGRMDLMRAIFRNSHNANSLYASKSIAAGISELNVALIPKQSLTERLKAKQYSFDFKPLRIAGDKMKSVKDILQAIANLPSRELIEEMVDELDTDEKESDLVSELERHHKTFHVGTLIKRIWSGLKIPNHARLPTQQPFGGVADITNKGNFDKLLISEFAFDDVVFMSRLANNESLYHHRESPPSNNDYVRIIFLDCTLKNWGTIKALSHAIHLAIALHPKSKTECLAYGVGENYFEIGHQDIDEVIQGLGFLDSSLDPGKGLLKYFAENKHSKSEMFFVGSQESLTRSAMTQFIAENGKAIDYWIHPSDDGKISLYKNPKSGKRFVQEIKLPLAQLWVRKSKPKQTKEYNEYNEYVSLDDYPILFPFQKMRKKFESDAYQFGLTKYNALLKGSVANILNRGWKLIKNNLGSSKELLAVITKINLEVVGFIKTTDAQYILQNFETGEIKELVSESWWKGSRVERRGLYFYVTNGARGNVVTTNGEILQNFDALRDKETPFVVHRGFKEVYKNIRKIHITAENKLRFNLHDLFIEKGRFKMFAVSHHIVANVISVQSNAKGMFEFKDGSKIYHNKSGMLILDSSNPEIPRIFVPSVLGSTLGLATENYFAGDVYYRDRKRRVVVLLNLPKDQYLKTIKIVKNFVKCSLKDTRSMVISGTIECEHPFAANTLNQKLMEEGYSTKVIDIGIEQKLLEPIEFNKRFIQPFIDQILSHGV